METAIRLANALACVVPRSLQLAKMESNAIVTVNAL
jgi:hypothetical protein